MTESIDVQLASRTNLVPTQPVSRIYFVDYLRAAIISLVFLHHTAITYGASGSWYYVVPATSSGAEGVLSLFTNFNQAWFMGLFFLLSGYFTPSSCGKKGVSRFIKNRLIRLGIPLLAFFFILNPITVYLAAVHSSPAVLQQEGISVPLHFNFQFYISNLGTGPLWFVEMLLIFDLGFALTRVIATKDKLPKQDFPFPSYRKIGAFILLLAASAYLLRIVMPIGQSFLQFPSLFDLPQYLSFFIIGTYAGRRDLLMKMPDTMAKWMFGLALLASATLLPLAIIGTKVPSLGWGSLYGYGSLSSAFYALWDSTFAVGTSMFMIGFFRRHYNSRGRLWKYLSEHFYTAYVIQAPVIVFVAAFVLNSIHIESILNFILAGIIAVPLIWALSCPVRKIPYANRIL